MSAAPFEAVLFDLDGTLADTAQDLAAALNATLQHFGKPPLPFEHIRPVVSHGGIALIKLGFGIQPDHPDFEPRRQFLLRHYQDNICRHTRLFDGMDKVLADLCERNIPWGIVTNKPSWLTNPLMAELPLPCPGGCVVSGDTCARNKPDPMPLHHACELLGVDARRCLYIGDAERDIQAGHAAGMATGCALWGYFQAHDCPRDWQADYYFDQPDALPGILKS